MLKLFRAALAAIALASIATQPVAAQILTTRAYLLPRAQSASVGVAFISSIEATGWSAVAGPALGALPSINNVGGSEFDAGGPTQKTVAVTRQGFDSSGNPVANIVDTLVITKRVRQPVPNFLLADGSRVALSDYVYSTDSIAGVDNGSIETSPKPIGGWAAIDHKVVGNTLTPEIVAFHRNGIAAVVVSAVDSTAAQCATATASLLTDSIHPNDSGRVLAYQPTLNLSACANGTITVNAKVFPRIGTDNATYSASSVLDSSQLAVQTYGFAPQVYLKNAALAAAPVYVSLASTGSAAGGSQACLDETVTSAGVGSTSGVQKVSTTWATAALKPFCGIASATNALKAATALTSGVVDGSVIRVGAGTFPIAAPTSPAQNEGELIIERDPAVARSAAIISGGVSAITFGVKWLRLRDVTFQKSGGSFISLASGGQIGYENAAWDMNGATVTPFARASATYLRVWIDGLTITGTFGASLIPVNNPVMLTRGVTASSTSGSNIGSRMVLGSTFNKVGLSTISNFDGSVVAFNHLFNLGAQLIGLTTTTGFAFVQNEIETTTTTSTKIVGWSSDEPDSASITHLLDWMNSYAGAWNAGRDNVFYDSTPSVYRQHRLNSVVGNIIVSPNIKQDMYISGPPANASNAEAALHIGGFPISHGVGMRGNLIEYADSTGKYFGSTNSDRNFYYPGIGYKSGTQFASPNTTLIASTIVDPLYNAPLATTLTPSSTLASPTYVAGTGGGDYTLKAGSPAKAMVTNCLLPKDIRGNTRAATCSAGANE